MIRMVADDLTGALDTGAQFADAGAPPAVTWSEWIAADNGTLVVDTGNRDRTPEAAARAFGDFIAVLAPQAHAVSYLKLDSLLRGHAALEIAACARHWPGRPIIVAPAMPYQGRVTRNGRQWSGAGDAAQVVGEDIEAALAGSMIVAQRRRPGDDAPAGVSLWDAESDADLSRIVDAGMRLAETPIWCGSAGLAGALAKLQPAPAPTALTMPNLAMPLLGIFGSNHPVMVGQLAAVTPHVLRVTDAGRSTLQALQDRLLSQQVVFVTFDIPPGTARDAARIRIDQLAAQLLPRIPCPGTLVASGGETLRGICDGLSAGHLDIDGQLEPGVPVSRINGGRWHGVRVISKSGAFGGPRFLVTLIDQARRRTERPEQ